jgi:hypothetical protein
MCALANLVKLSTQIPTRMFTKYTGPDVAEERSASVSHKISWSTPSATQLFQHPPQPTSDITTIEATLSSETSE